MIAHARSAAAAALFVLLGAGASPTALHAQPTRTAALPLWKQGGSAFGIFVPSERAPNATDAAGNRLPPLYTEQGAHTLGANPLLHELVEEPMVVTDGVLTPPTRPGLGVTPRPAFIEKYIQP